MARSGKIGIDYWSHDSDMSSDKKIRIIMAKHGIAGYGFFNLLLDRIFGDKGYYLQIDDDFNILFSNDCNIDLNAYILMLNDCIEKELFDKDLYDKYNILTSRRIQKNYCDACQRRKEMFFISDYMLLEPEKEFGLKVNVYISSLNADIKEQNADISKQIEKEKESKEKVKEKKYSDDSLRVAEYLLKCIIEHSPDFRKPNIEKWAEEIDRAIRIDKRTPRDLCEVARWATSDTDFWQGNILSAVKLRKQFDQVQIKMRKEQQTKQPAQTNAFLAATYLKGK